MIWLFRALGSLPLWLNHLIGFALGWLAWWLSPRHRCLTRENVRLYAQCIKLNDAKPLLRAAIAEQGKGISELAVAWTAPPGRLYGLVRECIGWQHIDAAQAERRPIILVTPHLGCYDIAGRYLSGRMPITALYRPPKQKWLDAIMQQGRVRAGGATAAADAGGVRSLLRALKGGGNIVVLPDQVPGGGLSCGEDSDKRDLPVWGIISIYRVWGICLSTRRQRLSPRLKSRQVCGRSA